MFSGLTIECQIIVLFFKFNLTIIIFCEISAIIKNNFFDKFSLFQTSYIMRPFKTFFWVTFCKNEEA
jgi:hypothetical protein